MKSHLVFVGLLCLMLQASSQAEEETATRSGHLFILSGQSNMTGNLKKGFTTTVMEALGEDNVSFVHCMRSGRGIRFWVRDYELPKDHERHGTLKSGNGEEFTRLVKAVKDSCDARSFETVTLIWMQGESDAGRDLGVAYERSFTTLLSRLKKELGLEQLYFVIGRISDHGLHGEKAAGWKLMREVQEKLADSDPLGAWIDTDDLNGGDEANPRGNLHYPKEESITLGKRFGKAALQQLAGIQAK